MTPRKLIALWAVLLAGVALLGYQGLTGADEGPTEASDAPTASAPEASSGPDVQVVVYYFHTDRRCESCLMLEREGRQAVERNFTEELNREALARVPDYAQPAIGAVFVGIGLYYVLAYTFKVL